MKPFHVEEELHHFDGKLYKIECDNSGIQKVTLVWQRNEQSYQKEYNRLNKQLEQLMKENC